MEKEILKYFNDIKFYIKVIVDEWSFRRYKVFEIRDKFVNSYLYFLFLNSFKFFRSFDNNFRSLDFVKFYIIFKIYKLFMVGRLIAVLYSYITRFISIFVDELVKFFIIMFTVLRDFGELI